MFLQSQRSYQNFSKVGEITLVWGKREKAAIRGEQFIHEDIFAILAGSGRLGQLSCPRLARLVLIALPSMSQVLLSLAGVRLSYGVITASIGLKDANRAFARDA